MSKVVFGQSCLSLSPAFSVSRIGSHLSSNRECPTSRCKSNLKKQPRLHRINSSTFSNPSARSLAFGVLPIGVLALCCGGSNHWHLSLSCLPLLHRLALRNAGVVRCCSKGISPPLSPANPNPPFFLTLLSQHVPSRSYATAKACVFRTISINPCLFPDPFDGCFRGFLNSRVPHLGRLRLRKRRGDGTCFFHDLHIPS